MPSLSTKCFCFFFFLLCFFKTHALGSSFLLYVACKNKDNKKVHEALPILPQSREFFYFCIHYGHSIWPSAWSGIS
ncbi:hypothetical protein V1514DRAFT_334596 [Lipomyces japonicus]|uniref:uncharacterized protein n=1 Tax=Lipomyces japonicus TaxID=56871 RepID=UPI0034CF4933